MKKDKDLRSLLTSALDLDEGKIAQASDRIKTMGEKAIPAINEALDDQRAGVRAVALGAYWNICRKWEQQRASEAFEVVERFLSDDSPAVRQQAVWGAAELAKIVASVSLAKTLEPMLSDDPQVSGAAASCLGFAQAASDDGLSAMRNILDRQPFDHSEFFSVAFSMLGHGDRALDLLTDALLNLPEANRNQLLFHLQYCNDGIAGETAIDVLTSALSRVSAGQQKQVLYALKEHGEGTARAIPVLVDLLDAAGLEPKLMIIEIFGLMGSKAESVIPKLLDIQKKAGRPRTAAKRAMNLIDPDRQKSFEREQAEAAAIRKAKRAEASLDKKPKKSSKSKPKKRPKKLLLKGHKAEVSGVAVSPDGSHIASVDWQGMLYVWSPWKGEHLSAWKVSDLRSQQVVFVDEKVAATVGFDGTVRFINIENGQEISTLSVPGNEWTWVLGVSPCRRFIATGSNKSGRSGTIDAHGLISVFDVSGSEPLAVVDGRISAFVFGRIEERDVFLFSSTKDKVAEFDLKTQKSQHFKPSIKSAARIALSPDGTLIATAHCNPGPHVRHFVRVTDLRSGELKAEFGDHQSNVIQIAFSPDGQYVAAASWDKTIDLFRLRSGELIDLKAKHTKTVSGCDFLPDGQTLVTSGWDKTVRCWNLKPFCL